MYYKKVHITQLELFQKQLLEQLPKDAFQLVGVLPQWSDNLLELTPIKKLIYQIKLFHKIDYIAVITMAPHSQGPVHIDGDAPEFALNIPLLNCENTFMSWYSSEQTPKKFLIEDNKTYLGVDRESCTKLASIEMNEPYYVNIKQLHDGHNPNDTWRLLLSIRLKNFNLV